MTSAATNHGLSNCKTNCMVLKKNTNFIMLKKIPLIQAAKEFISHFCNTTTDYGINNIQSNNKAW